jgi:acyl-CoA synthetase (AMP-forming)/AMP-acid ligase II
MAGVRGCFLERFDVENALDLVERYRVTAFVGVPAMLARLVNSNPDPRLWRVCASGYPPATTCLLRFACA